LTEPSVGKEADRSPLGILPQIVKQIVDRRVYIKQLLGRLPNESTEAKDCEQKADTLKKIFGLSKLKAPVNQRTRSGGWN
jgi:hypothetical protein